MQKIFWLVPLLLTCLLCSCNKPLPTLDAFNAHAWKEDADGCKKTRSEMIESIVKQKNKLLSLDEMEIMNVLGKPDRRELYKRNQKFFYYFIEPSNRCEQAFDNPKKLAIRFNAVGLAKEINVE